MLLDEDQGERGGSNEVAIGKRPFQVEQHPKDPSVTFFEVWRQS